MKKTWAVIAGLALALPMAAYVAGSLASAGGESGDRTPIRIVESTDGPSTDDPSTSPSRKPSVKPSAKPSAKPSPPRTQTPKADDRGPETVRVQPDDLDDDDDDDGRDDDGADDD